MRVHVEITRAGSGSWGGVQVTYEVRHTVRTWNSRAGLPSRSLTTYSFHVPGLATHEFATLAEAEADASRSIASSVELEGEKMPPRLRDISGSTFAPEVGRIVDSVASTDDGLTMTFSPHDAIWFGVDPIIEMAAEGTVTPGAADYREQIQRIVGRALIATEDYWDAGIVLDFGTIVLRIDPGSIVSSPIFEIVLQGNLPILLADDPPWAEPPLLTGLWSLRHTQYDAER